MRASIVSPATTAPSKDELAVIRARYLLVTPTPWYADGEGRLWLERSWHQDFVAHFDYLKSLVACAPRLPRGTEPDLVRFDAPADASFELVDLPPQTTYLRALLTLPRTAWILWKAVGRAEIVHSGIGGWPYPLGWIVNPFAWIRRKRFLINVESDWKLGTEGRRRFRQRLVDMDPLRDWMARWSCRRAQLALFTHVNYRDEVCGEGCAKAHVSPAVWVNDADVLGAGAASEAWEEKLREPVRLLFAGRLVAAKGVGTLLDALRALESRSVESRVDFIGRGEERDACLAAAAACRSVRITVLEPVPYGKEFFELVQRYHAVLVPTLSEEQPRIVFDANSQAVPVIASDTGGHRPYVEHERTGWLVPAGDANALAGAIERASGAPSDLRSMGLAALAEARGRTHQAMHRWRSRLIRDYLT
jgi:glycosyltransferase involved in cell wall biosynthesis